MFIFDGHTHLLNLIPPNGIDEAELALMLKRADTCGVERMLLLGAVLAKGEFPYPSVSGIRRINDQTLEAVRRHPDRLLGLCYLNPSHDPAFVREEMDRCIRDGPLVGVKQEVALNARDAHHDPMMDYCATLGCPLLFHSWYHAVKKKDQESDPSDIAHLARRHPNVRIIMAHMMGCGVKGMSDIAPYPNVSVDVAGSPPIAGVFEYALERLGPQRILFGSDWPIRDFATQLGKVESQELSEADQTAIRGGNLLKLIERKSHTG